MADGLPTISVITPSFNHGRFIERTIRSVLNQKYSNTEYIVCDGGSTDDTVEILQRYSSALQWISEKDSGQAHAVNKGIMATSGKIIGWLNSDDVYYPRAFEAVARRFAADPDIDLVYGDGNHIGIDDQFIERYPTEPWNSRRLIETCFLCQPAVFFRRSVIERWGYLDESLNYCMDYEYWIRLAMGGARFQHEERLLAGSRFYPENKTLGSRIKVHAEINDMLKSRLGSTPTAWILGYSHVLANDKFKIERSCRRRYVGALAMIAIYSSLRWNKRITGDLMKFIICSLAAALRHPRIV